MFSKDSCIGRRKLAWLSGAAMSFALAATPALAQTEPDETDDQTTQASADQAAADTIVVTGSRIRRAGFDTLQAATVTDEEDIEVRGYTNVVDALQETPGFAESGTSPIGNSQGTFSAGQSYADFFGLGSQRTLTLVNGRRFVSSNAPSGSGNTAAPGSQVDLNVIPAGLVKRVETVAIGGAPIYGSDAIAGTVNIILKDDFEGVETTGQYGVTEEGDAESYSLQGMMGGNFGGGRGNAVLSAEYNKQDGIVQSSRTGLVYSLPNPFAPPNAAVTTDLVYAAMTEGGLPYNTGFGNITDASGQSLQFNEGGQLVPYVLGGDFGYSPVITEGGDGVRMADHYSLLSPTERTLINGIGHYDLTPWARAFVETSYAHSIGKELSEVAAFASPFITGTFLTFDLDNAYLDPAARQTLVANGITDQFYAARNFSDLLDRDGLGVTTVDVYRFVGGFEGDFDLSDQAYHWDISYNFGRSENSSELKYINEDRFLLALDAVRNASGDIVCASGGDCVPLNLFGEGAFSDEAAAYVLDRGVADSLNTQEVFSANLAGELPFGFGGADPIAFNIGAEYRKESGEFKPDALLAGGTSLLGLSLASPYVATSGSYNTKEVYGEMVAPLVSDAQNVSFIRSLSFEGAVRYVDNSLTGGDLTWSAGGRFTPRIDGWGENLTLRGVYTHAIRAPAIVELFSGAVPTRGSISDPCDAANFQQGNNPSIRAANCTQALSQFGYASPENYNSTTFGLSPIGTTSGNPNLENEEADSWSIGFVYEPVSLPGFRMAVDWSNIELTNGIQSVGINTLLSACYDNANFPSATGCDAFRRLTSAEVGPGTDNPTRVAGDIANGYGSGYINTSSLDFAGLIVTAEYGFDLADMSASFEDAGSLALSAKLFYQDKYESVTGLGQQPFNSVGNAGFPEYRGQFTVGYQLNRFDALVQALWTSSVKNDTTADNSVILDEFNNIDDYWKFNGTLGYQITDRVKAQVVVNNIFDNRASDAQKLSGAFGTYDVIGRSFLFRLSASFH